MQGIYGNIKLIIKCWFRSWWRKVSFR